MASDGICLTAGLIQSYGVLPTRVRNEVGPAGPNVLSSSPTEPSFAARPLEDDRRNGVAWT